MKKLLALFTAFLTVLSSFPHGARAAVGMEEEFLFSEIPTVVSSTLQATRADIAPSTIFTVSGDEIRRWGIRRLSELVDRLIPGAASIDDTDDMILAFRGVTSDTSMKVLLLINGHYSNIQLNNGPQAEVELGMMEDIKSVEVITGPGSALYGSGAIIGVVNLITESGKDESGQGARMKLGYGGGQYKLFDMAVGAKKDDDVNYYFSMGKMESQGFNVKNNAPLNVNRFPPSHRFYGNVNYKEFELMTRMVRSSRAFYHQTANLTTGTNQWTNYDTFFIDARQNLSLGNTKTVFNANFDSNQIQRHDFNTGLKIRGAGEKRYSGKITTFFTGLPRNNITVGAEYRLDDYGSDWEGANYNLSITRSTNPLTNITGIPSDTYTRRFVTPYTRRVYNVFGQDIITLSDSLTWLIGGRYDFIPNFRPGAKQAAVTPRTALVWSPDQQWAFKAMYSSGFRQPHAPYTSPDGFAFGGAFDGTMKVPEIMKSYELGAVYRTPSNKMDFGLNTFYNTLKDIHSISGSGGSGANAGGRINYVGYEAIANARLVQNKFFGRIIHQHVQLVTTATDISRVQYVTPDQMRVGAFPTDLTKLLLEYRFTDVWSVNTNCNVNWLTYTRASTGARSERIGYYNRLNANVVYQPNAALQLVLSGYNLTNDKDPVLSANTDKTNKVAPRHYNATVQFKF